MTNLPLLTGEAHPLWDADAAYAPWQMLVGDAARAFRLLRWDPWSNAGSPDGFDPQFGALSPIHLWVGLVFGGRLAGFYALWLGSWWLSGVGVLLLARWLRAPAAAAAIAALAFSFSGFQLCHAQHTSFLFVYASMPWVAWRLDVALCTRRLRPVAESAAIFGLASLGGYPGVSVVSGLFLGLWATARIAFSSHTAKADEGGPPPVPRTDATLWLARASALWAVIAVVVAAPTTLGLAYEARGFSDRSDAVSFENAVESNALLPAALLSAAGPYVANLKRADRSLWTETSVSSMSLYTGAVALWLAVCGALLGSRRRLRQALLAIGLLGVGFALGTTLPLRGWLYDVFPPSRYFRHASIFRAWFELAIALAGALAWSDLAAASRAGATRVPAAVASGGVLLAASQLLLARSVAVEAAHATGIAFHGVVVWGALLALAVWLGRRARPQGLGAVAMALLALAALDLAWTAWLQRPMRMDFRERTTESWEMVAQGRQTGFDLLQLGSTREFTSVLFPSNTNKGLPQRIPTLRNYSPLLNRFHREMVWSLAAIPWAIGDDRFWFLPEGTPFVELSDANYEAMMARTRRERRRFVLLHLPRDVLTPVPEGRPGRRRVADAAAIARLAPARRLPHEILRYDPDHLTLEVTAPSPGYAIVTDRWARGWRTWLDGAPVPTLGASFVYRAVRVPAGRHRIEMRYAPRSFPGLLVASWGMLAIVGLASLTGWTRRRTRT